MSEQPTSELGRAIQEVAEKAQLLVREEIELAKAEMDLKVRKLVKGAAIGAVAGIFLLAALLFALHGMAWGLWSLLIGDPTSTSIWVGFAVLALILIVLGAIAGLIALRLIKRGSPPVPQMAIEEAQLIRQTVTGPHASGRSSVSSDQVAVSSGTASSTSASPGAVVAAVPSTQESSS